MSKGLIQVVTPAVTASFLSNGEDHKRLTYRVQLGDVNDGASHG